MAANNFDLSGFLNSPQAQANKAGAIQYLQSKGIIDTAGKPIPGMSIQAPAAPKKGLLDKASDIVGSIFPGKKIGEAIGTEIARIQYPSAQLTGPNTKEVVGDAAQAALAFVPVGRIAEGAAAGARALGVGKAASAVGKIATGALTGEAFDISSNLEDNKKGFGILSPGIGTAVGTAIPGASIGTKAVVRFAQNSAPRIIDSLIKPLAKDFSYGKDPGRAVSELGIVANNFDDLATKIRASRQTIGQEIGALGRTLSTKPIVNIGDSLGPLTDAMHEAASQNNPTLLSRLSAVKKAITHELEPAVDKDGNITIKEVGARKLDGLTFSEARDILGKIGDITQFTGNPSDDKAVNSALKNIYGHIKEATLAAADTLDPENAARFRKLTEQYADLSSAEIATKYRDKIVQRSNLIGLSPQVAGIGTALMTFVATGGAATPAILAGVTGAAIDKLASTPGFKTRIAALLSKKSPEEINILFRKVPVLQTLFPKGGAISPGDRLLQKKKPK